MSKVLTYMLIGVSWGCYGLSVAFEWMARGLNEVHTLIEQKMRPERAALAKEMTSIVSGPAGGGGSGGAGSPIDPNRPIIGKQ